MAIRKQEYDDDQPKNKTPITLHISSRLQGRIKKAVAESDLSVEEYLENVLEQSIPTEDNEISYEQ